MANVYYQPLTVKGRPKLCTCKSGKPAYSVGEYIRAKFNKIGHCCVACVGTLPIRSNPPTPAMISARPGYASERNMGIAMELVAVWWPKCSVDEHGHVTVSHA